MREERIGEGVVSIKIDGSRVLRVLVGRGQARALRDAMLRAKERIASRSSTGKASDEDLVDLIIAAIETESLDFQEGEG